MAHGGRMMRILVKNIGKIWKKLPPSLRTWITRRTQQKFTVSVVALVTNEVGEILLLNHLLRPRSGWGLPGGFIGIHEQPEAALRRELREETGLELDDVELYRVRTLNRHVEIIFLAKGLGDAEVRSREIIELRWFEVENVPAEMSLDQQFLIRKVLGT